MRLPAIALLLVLSAPSALAQRRPAAEVMAELHKRVKPHGVVITADGARIAWVEQTATPDGPADDRSTIHVLDIIPKNRQARTVTAKAGGPYDERELAFSPDGKQLAFLSDAAKKGQRELYVADLDSGKVTQLTTVIGHMERPSFSPDGTTIALLLIEGDADALGPLGPATRQTGVVEEVIHEQRLVLVPVAGGAPRPVSPAELYVYEYAWRPDGKAWAAVAAPGSGDDNWWIAKLHVFEDGGTPDRVVYEPPLQICEPTFSPDGSKIAFIGGLMSDQGSNGGDVFVVPASGGKAVNMTPGLRGSASTLHWWRDEEIFFAMLAEGDSAFATVPAMGGKPTVKWRGSRTLSREWGIGAAFSADGVGAAAISSSFDQPPEVVAGALGAWIPRTSLNTALKSPAGPARNITWKNEGKDVQGWLIAPAEGTVADGAKAPMVVVVHGGPAGAAKNDWSETAMILASQGYYVFLPNPRGSFGQGEAFTRANVKDFGYGDLRDILKGVDTVLKSTPVDPARIGLYGHSYGGFMAMWAVTQTTRFAASVASAGIANWQSYYGQNRIDKWMIPYFGKSVYDDPAVYARSSPITFIKKVKTPTLMLNGERDAECPLPQGQEMWHALKTLGVPTQLVVYEGEGHHFRDPKNERDHTERMLGWFEKYLR